MLTGRGAREGEKVDSSHLSLFIHIFLLRPIKRKADKWRSDAEFLAALYKIYINLKIAPCEMSLVVVRN